jgi:predicted nucleic acid-binding Zn ribbon protein
MASSAEIAAVAFLDASLIGVEICSERCEAERKKARRRVRQIPRPCIACGKDFIPTRSDAKTCSDRCRQRLHRGRSSPDAVTRSELGPI